MVAVEVDDDEEELPNEKIPLLVSEEEDVAAAVDDELPNEKIPLLDSEELTMLLPPLPKENNPEADEAGGAPALGAAAAAAGVTDVVNVSDGFSDDETQKEKVGFMEELQLLVGARAWDKLE